MTVPQPNTIGSPTAPLMLEITAIETIAEQCKMFTLAASDGAALPACTSGSHIGLHLPNGFERQYSLLNFGPSPHFYRFAVKRDVASRGGSSWLCDEASVGDRFTVEPPRNNFPLLEDEPVSVLIAGGIGITPIRAMLDRLIELGRESQLHFASRNRSEAPFADELVSLPGVHLHFDEEAGGLLDLRRILEEAPQGAHLYCCGPGPMLAAFEETARSVGIPAERVHVEYFTQKYETATEGGFIVELARTGKELHIQQGQTILDAVRALGIDASASCEEGICGACETRVISGEPDHRDAILSEREREANKTMFICCSGSKSARLVLDL